MYPTPYRWTTDDGVTHVFYRNHLPPSTGFGWGSLCDAVQIPIEGEHFELDDAVTAADVTCPRCQDRLDGPYMSIDDDSIAGMNGCLIRVERDEDGVTEQAERLCRGLLHEFLSFEPDSFSGNLRDQVDTICDECWETYVSHQWQGDVEGAELCVEVYGTEDRSEYYAASIKALRGGNQAQVRLVSENGLETDIRREDIESISLTPAQQVNY